jgi:hypothetical protein
MKSLKLILLFAVVVAVILGSLSVAIAAVTEPIDLSDSAATLTVESGVVEHRRGDADEWTVVESSIAVSSGDWVRTGPGGFAEINLYDQGAIRIDENTEMQLELAQWDPDDPTTFVADVWVTTGRLWSRLFDFVSPESSFEVRTSSTVATVRGTVFSMWAERDGASGVYVDSHAVGVSVGGLELDDVIEGELFTVGPEAEGHKTKRGRALSERWVSWIEKNREHDVRFDGNVAARMKAKVRQGAFVDFAERMRLMMSGRDRRGMLERQFEMRKHMLDRLHEFSQPREMPMMLREELEGVREPIKQDAETTATLEIITETTDAVRAEEGLLDTTASVDSETAEASDSTVEAQTEPIDEPVVEESAAISDILY